MCVWEILGLPHVLGSFQEKAGGEPSGHAPKGEGRVTHSSRPLLPSRVVSKKRVEGDQMWGWGEGDQVEETDFFFCATAWSLQPCVPPGFQLPGAQVALSRMGSGRRGDTGMGVRNRSSSGADCSNGEPGMGSSPRE